MVLNEGFAWNGTTYRSLTQVATREVTEGHGNDWSTVLEGELSKARAIQSEQPGLKFREIEQAVCGVFLSSQPIGQKARTPDLTVLISSSKPDRQAWSIVVTVNEQNDIRAFKITVGADPLFSTVKGDKRSPIQDTAISAEAMLPGGPYDLWRKDEPSRRVKDFVSRTISWLQSNRWASPGAKLSGI